MPKLEIRNFIIYHIVALIIIPVFVTCLFNTFSISSYDDLIDIDSYDLESLEDSENIEEENYSLIDESAFIFK